MVRFRRGVAGYENCPKAENLEKARFFVDISPRYKVLKLLIFKGLLQYISWIFAIELFLNTLSNPMVNIPVPVESETDPIAPDQPG
jgi:hypothetical protein